MLSFEQEAASGGAKTRSFDGITALGTSQPRFLAKEGAVSGGTKTRSFEDHAGLAGRKIQSFDLSRRRPGGENGFYTTSSPSSSMSRVAGGVPLPTQAARAVSELSQYEPRGVGEGREGGSWDEV